MLACLNKAKKKVELLPVYAKLINIEEMGSKGKAFEATRTVIRRTKKSSVFSFVIVRPKASLGTFSEQDLSRNAKARGANQLMQRSGRIWIEDEEVCNQDGGGKGRR